nr:hypothetical protein [Tanacetum cinerariifolium]
MNALQGSMLPSSDHGGAIAISNADSQLLNKKGLVLMQCQTLIRFYVMNNVMDVSYVLAVNWISRMVFDVVAFFHEVEAETDCQVQPAKKSRSKVCRFSSFR